MTSAYANSSGFLFEVELLLQLLSVLLYCYLWRNMIIVQYTGLPNVQSSQSGVLS